MQKTTVFIIKPEWEEIERIRNESKVFLELNNIAPEGVTSNVMVISELVENAIKYGAFKDENSTVTIQLYITHNSVIVEVENPIDDSKNSYIRYLDETIQWIRGYQDPFETYIIKLRQISSKPLQDAESGLGLVRISYEGQSILDFYVSEDKVLHVSAIYNW